MRIVLVGPAYPYRGGIAHFTNRLAQALDAAGHEVLLLTFSRQYPALLFPGKTQFEKTPWKLPNRPVRLIDSVNPFSWWKAGQWLAHQHPEVVVLMHWMPFFVPAYLGLLRAMRRAMPPRALPKVALLLHTVWPHQRFPLTKHLMKALIQRADTFVTLSEHLTEELRGFAPEAEVAEGFHPVYDHFHAPIDPAVAREHLGLPDKPTILFFGYIRHYKGLDVLIEAMPLVRQQVDVQLVVAGEFYENEEELRGRAEDLGLGGTLEESAAVQFYPEYIPNEEIHHYFSAADVVVQPYRSGVQSGVMKVALFFGKPMIVSDLGVLSEAIGNAGYVVPPEDPGALADTIVRFFRSDTKKMIEGARAQGKRYTWAALVERLTSFWAA